MPWYPERPPGGAEVLARGAIHALRNAGVDARVLTSCVPSFRADWGINALPSGPATVDGVPVERFEVDERDWKLFDQVNLRIMRGEPVTPDEAQVYVDETIRSRALEARLRHLPNDASVVFMPYLYGTTYWGMQARPGWLWPCAHDEPYARLPPFKRLFDAAMGILCNSHAERDVVRRLYAVADGRALAIGAGMDTDLHGEAARFRARHGIQGDFLLCVARKDHGKNVDQLVSDFAAYARTNADVQLLLVGPGTVPIPSELRHRVLDLGFVPEQEKLDALAAASALCMPSVNESFSFVLMEAWLLGTPVLVNAGCDVTSEHARLSAGGLAYDGPDEFAASVDWLLQHPEPSRRMAANGAEYVRRNFAWPIVARRLRAALRV